MAGQWYCRIGGVERGPFTAAQLRAMVLEGRLSAADPLRRGDSEVWVPAASVKGLFPTPGAAAEPSMGKPAADEPLPTPRSRLRAQPLGTPPKSPRGSEKSSPDAGIDLTARPASPPPSRGTDAAAGSRGLEFLADEQLVGASFRAVKPLSAPARAKKKALVLRRWLLPALLGLLGLLTLVFFIVTYEPTSRPGEKGGTDSTAGKSPPAGEAADKAGEKAAKSPAVASDNPAGSPPPASVVWIDASRAAWKCGNVTLRVQSAVIAPATRIDAAQRISDTPEECLLVHLELSNQSHTRKIEYAGWGLRGAEPQLTDELNNKYGMQKVPGGRFEGQVQAKPIYPEKSLEDVLVFERPVERAKVLRLQLPAGAFSGQGTGYFEIPMSMVKHGAVAAGKPPTQPATAKPKGDDAKMKEQRGASVAVPARSGFAGAAELLDDSPPQRTNDAKTDLGVKPDSVPSAPVSPQAKRGPPPAPPVKSGR